MLSSLKISNYKAHREIAMLGLGRVNLLLGRNNAGKTAILEAVFLEQFHSNPKAGFEELNVLRGIQSNDFVWESVFHRFNLAQPAVIETVRDGATHTLRMSAMHTHAIQKSSSGILTGSSEARPDGILCQYFSSDKSVNVEVVISAKRGRGEEQKRQDSLRNSAVSFIPSRARYDVRSESIRFGIIESRREEQVVLDALKLIEPRISVVRTIQTSTGPEIVVDIGEKKLVPITWMGDGMLRMFSIITAVALTPGGTVLIDEVENGLHYSVMPKLWATVLSVAEARGVQIFAATHNDEMIQAVVTALQPNRLGQLRAYRTDRSGDATRVVDYSGELVASSHDSQQEIR
jgi:hypothetical protein